MIIHSLDVLLSQFGTNLLFHVQFYLLLLNVHTDFQEAGQVVCYSHLFKNFPHISVIHTFKGFYIVNKAEVDVFQELCCFFNDPTDVGNLISNSPAFSRSSLNMWKFMVHVLLKLGFNISVRDSWTFMGKSKSVSCWSTAPFFWVLVHTRFCLCPTRVYFPSLV